MLFVLLSFKNFKVDNFYLVNMVVEILKDIFINYVEYNK